MRKLFFIFFVTVFLACNNPETTDTSRSDTTVIDRDNTMNRDTGINRTDTMDMMDSLR